MQYSWDPMSNSMMGIYLEALQIAYTYTNCNGQQMTLGYLP